VLAQKVASFVGDQDKMTSLFAVCLISAVFSRPMERIRSLIPSEASSVFECYATALQYEAPLKIDYGKRPYRLAPGICHLPEISPDGLTYVFKVRTIGVTAYDVARSIEKLRDRNNPSPNAWMVKDVESVYARDEKNLVVRLRKRCHYFPWLMAMPQTSVVLENGKGTGPFELSLWRKNHEMVFIRKNVATLPKDPERVDKVRYLVIDDMMTQWLMFLKGEIDFIEDLSRDSLDAVLSDAGILDRTGSMSHSSDLLQLMYLGFNTRDAVFSDNPALRRALCSAFNFDLWKKFQNDLVERATTPVPKGVSGRYEGEFEYSYNLKRAKELLSLAGYPGGIDPNTGRRLELTLTIGRPTQQSRELGELLSSFFDAIGIKLKLDFMTWSAYLEAINEGRTQMFLLSWLGDYPDAQNFLQLFYSPYFRPGPNRGGYRNQEFDAYYEKALDSLDEDERNKYWIKCQQIICSDCPVLLLGYRKSFVVSKKSLKGYIPGDFQYGRESELRIGRR
jgi:peptide/nickel transport system substrate-binding protein